MSTTQSAIERVLTDRRGSQTFGYDQLDRLIICEPYVAADAQALVS